MNDRIKQIIEKSGLKQKEFAERLGVSPGSVSNWIAGASAPTAAARASICSTFGVRREWLETGAGEMFETRTPSLTDATLDELQKAYIQKLVDSLPAEVQTRVVEVIKDYLDARTQRERDVARQAELEEIQYRLEEERQAIREAERQAQDAADAARRKYWVERHRQELAGTWKRPTNNFEKVDVVNVDQRTEKDELVERLLAIQQEKRKEFGLEDE